MEKVDQIVKSIDSFIEQYPSVTQFGRYYFMYLQRCLVRVAFVDTSMISESLLMVDGWVENLKSRKITDSTHIGLRRSSVEIPRRLRYLWLRFLLSVRCWRCPSCLASHKHGSHDSNDFWRTNMSEKEMDVIVYVCLFSIFVCFICLLLTFGSSNFCIFFYIF